MSSFKILRQQLIIEPFCVLRSTGHCRKPGKIPCLCHIICKIQVFLIYRIVPIFLPVIPREVLLFSLPGCWYQERLVFSQFGKLHEGRISRTAYNTLGTVHQLGLYFGRNIGNTGPIPAPDYGFWSLRTPQQRNPRTFNLPDLCKDNLFENSPLRFRTGNNNKIIEVLRTCNLMGTRENSREKDTIPGHISLRKRKFSGQGKARPEDCQGQ